MKLLCDTHIILWAQLDDRRLSARARNLLRDRANTILFSLVSLWEVAINVRAGRMQVDVDEVHDNCLRAGMDLLPIRVAHLAAVSRMTEVPHRDPFDHLLIAQARAEGVPLLTADRLVQRYPIEIIAA